MNENQIHIACTKLVNVLNDNESFVYLNGIHAIAALAAHNRVYVVNFYVEIFENIPREENNYGLMVSDRHRAIIAEALSMILRRSGSTAPKLVPSIISACLKIVRNLRPNSHVMQSVTQSGTNFQKLRLKPTTAIADITESEMNDDKKDDTVDLQEPELPSVPIETAVLADQLLLRQSALSLLADAIAFAGWTSQKYMTDVVDVAVGILTLETGYNEVMRLSRRTASFLLRYIVNGLQEKLFIMGGPGEGGIGTDSGSHLLLIYRTLKLLSDDHDDVVKLHVQTALSQIGELVREDISSNMGVNEKAPKITIL